MPLVAFRTPCTQKPCSISPSSSKRASSLLLFAGQTPPPRNRARIHHSFVLEAGEEVDIGSLFVRLLLFYIHFLRSLLFNDPKFNFVFHYLFLLFAFQLEKSAEKQKQTWS
jgi:hypothetical protein